MRSIRAGSTMKTITEHSAGGVVYRRKARGKTIKWLICKHSGYHKWALPKGIIEGRETPEETAVREVQEETGVTAKIIKEITPDVRYTYTKEIPAESPSITPQDIQAGGPKTARKVLVDKRVEFFLMEYQSGDIKNHNWEMEDVKWASENEALKLLAFEEERRTLKSALQLRMLQH